MAEPPSTAATATATATAPGAPPPPEDLTTLPQLQPLATLPCPLNARGAGPSSRAWQATPHPSASTPLLAVASADKSVYVWSLRNFQMVSKIEGGHKRSVRCVEWKDYGGDAEGGDGEGRSKKRKKTTLATGSFDANVGVWEHARAGRRKEWGDAAAAVDEDGDVDVDRHDDEDNNNEPDDYNDDGEDGEEWNFTTLLTGPDSEIKSMHFSPSHYSANLLATSSRDKSVWVWEEVEAEEWETLAVLQEHQGDVKCVRWCEGANVTVQDPHTMKRTTRIVGSRELLASGSYDDAIRLWRDVEEEGDWTCIALLEGHAGTVWDVSWEKWIDPGLVTSMQEGWEMDWEPRLLSCSDDLTLRVWRRELSEAEKEKKRNARGSGVSGVGALTQRLPSIIRPTGHFETWLEEAQLPQVHVRSVYAVDWSRKTGLVVSCAGDGTIAVYKEVEIPTTNDGGEGGDVVMSSSAATTEEHTAEQQQQHGDKRSTTKKWIVVALVEAAHDEYEINHVCWATRRDPGARSRDEEVIVSTGDEGDVKIWVLPEELQAGQV